MNVQQITEAEIKESIQAATSILREGLEEFTHNFKPEHSLNGFYAPAENIEWTPGFLTGQYWLAWELTKDNAFKEAALVHVDSFDNRIRNKIGVAHHDMGFLYSLSCVAAYRLVGSEKGKSAAILAADNLLSRFHEKGNFIQAWGAYGDRTKHRLIIDCLMNLPLLYWAAQETSDDKYRKIAELHTKTSLQNLVRDDFSTYHTYYFDPDTGKPEKGVTAQGYKDSTPWARGQAWGVYGTALSYLYTKDPACIDLFYKITDFFIDKVQKGCQDLVPYWDLCFVDADGEPKDSSAAVIACCGMFEMSKHLPDDKAEHYTGIAKQIAGSIARHYRTEQGKSNGLMLHGVYGKSSPYNTCASIGVDECTLWGDYFWLELLTRLNGDWKIYW